MYDSIIIRIVVIIKFKWIKCFQSFGHNLAQILYLFWNTNCSFSVKWIISVSMKKFWKRLSNNDIRHQTKCLFFKGAKNYLDSGWMLSCSAWIVRIRSNMKKKTEMAQKIKSSAILILNLKKSFRCLQYW